MWLSDYIDHLYIVCLKLYDRVGFIMKYNFCKFKNFQVKFKTHLIISE